MYLYTRTRVSPYCNWVSQISSKLPDRLPRSITGFMHSDRWNFIESGKDRLSKGECCVPQCLQPIETFPRLVIGSARFERNSSRGALLCHQTRDKHNERLRIGYFHNRERNGNNDRRLQVTVSGKGH